MKPIPDSILDEAYALASIPVKKPVTLAMVQAIRNIQGKVQRAPTRREILSELEKASAIDDTELCRQLVKLGWQEMITPSGELAS